MVAHITSNRAFYWPLVDGDFDEYIRLMEQEFTWGSHVEIHAFANMRNTPVVMHAPTFTQEFNPTEVQEAPLHLSYHLRFALLD